MKVAANESKVVAVKELKVVGKELRTVAKESKVFAANELNVAAEIDAKNEHKGEKDKES